MTTTHPQLPAGFEALQPFIANWNLTTSAERKQKRLDSSPEEMTAFFAEAQPLAASALELLDQKPLAELDRQEQTLMNLMLSLTHVSLAVEIQGSDEPYHAKWAKYVTITRSVADKV